MGISTHILDTSRGCPAEGVAVELMRRDGVMWRTVAKGVTNADGRVGNLLSETPEPGVWCLRFAIGDYFERLDVRAFYPEAEVTFAVHGDDGVHFHVPLLLNPFGFSTYRGS